MHCGVARVRGVGKPEVFRLRTAQCGGQGGGRSRGRGAALGGSERGDSALWGTAGTMAWWCRAARGAIILISPAP